ncbi:MAG TPA: peptidoglycan-binding protein [Polyangiaceae bacterium]|nr:peptidoglycan-binding protein [Polyangiaceae bacterium]
MSIRHTVQPGECFASIAARYGFEDYTVIYNHPANTKLKRIRPNPNVLFPGDVVAIPEPKPRELSLATGRVHPLKVRRPKKELRVVIKNDRGEALASTPYNLQIDGRSTPEEGTTDGDGLLKHQVPAGTQSVVVQIAELSLRMRLGSLAPLRDTPDRGVRGAQARLCNLGYNVGSIDGKLSRGTRAAIAMFQHDHEKPVDGELSPELIDLLLTEHGC